MGKKKSIVDKFKKLWPYYILQTLLATFALLVLVFVFGKDRIVLISSMGATAFIVFAMPTTISAQTKNVVGGHLTALIIGALFHMINMPYYVEFPLAVGITIFLMVSLDVEHPPAGGTVLAVVVNEVSPYPLIFAYTAISAILLTQCRYFLRNHLKDLI